MQPLGTVVPLVVDVIGSTGAPASSPGQRPPLSAAQLTAIANAVAARL